MLAVGGELWSWVLYGGLVAVLVVGMVVLSAFLGPRHRDRATGEVYECGMLATSSARLRISVRYWLVAIFFVVFDIETVFIFAWAIGLRELGWGGYAAISVFIGVLLLSLVYLWRQGALDWSRRGDERLWRDAAPTQAAQTPKAKD